MEWYGLHLNKDSLKKGIISDTPLNALAFFLGAPQTWRPRKCSDKEASLFRGSLAKCPTLSSEQIVVHGCYLMNPASEREDVVMKSGPMFINELEICEKMGVGKYVFHPGCSKKTQEGLQCTVDLIKAGLQKTKNVQILVENMTQTNRLCQTWEECRWVLDHVNDPRLGFCMDTAHCWGAGSKKHMFMDTLIDDFDRVVGIDRLGAIHLNDSKVAYGSNVDRHEDILVGQIPHSFWNKFVFDDRVRRIPAILETPSNSMPTLRMIIENGSVPKALFRDTVNVKITDPPKQTSINSFFISKPPKKQIYDEIEGEGETECEEKKERYGEESESESSRSEDGEESESESESESSEDEYKKEPIVRSEIVEKVLPKDLKDSVISFLSPYEKLEELIPEEWGHILFEEFGKPYFRTLKDKLLDDEKNGITIFPPINRIFRALEFVKPDQVKVFLLAQDPYIKSGQAEGLSFSVPKGAKIPPSLKRIYKELESDIQKFKAPYHGNLVKWAEQGVLLLNASLTVQAGKSNSHAKFGWLDFTKTLIKKIHDNNENLVFILMGNFAQKQCDFVDESKHFVIKTTHPSPLAGNAFFGSKPFSKCNEYLRSKGIEEINWRNY